VHVTLLHTLSLSLSPRLSPPTGERPATRGGATAICPSDVVLAKLTAKYPEFVERCTHLGVKYSALLAAEADPTIGAGRGWKSFFGRDTPDAVEARMSELNYTWQWLDTRGGYLKFKTPTLPAIRAIPGTSRQAFFNQMSAQVGNAEEFIERAKTSVPPALAAVVSQYTLVDFLEYGDGSTVETEPLLFARALCEEHAVEIAWEQGDVALLDNYAVMHARRDFEGPRRILASLVK
jgi:hypothetical protein